MNCSKANIEPFCVYYKAHESLNNLVKIASASLDLLKPLTERPDGLDQLNKVVQRTTEPWGPIWHNNVGVLREDAVAYLAGLAVVHSLSAFEHFLTFAKAECDRWNAVNGRPAVNGTWRNDDGDITLSQLYAMFGWSRAPIEPYEALFRFIQECRNCMVHRDGRASQGLCATAESVSLRECLANWPFSRENKHLPDLPNIVGGDQIVFAPKHAILSSATCYRIVEEVNSQIVRDLSDDGMVYMAAFHSLIDVQHPARLPNHRSPEKAVMQFLQSRYRVSDVDQEQVIASLRKLNVWEKVRKRHSEVYG